MVCDGCQLQRRSRKDHHSGTSRRLSSTPLAPTLLIDGDPNRSATRWAKRGGMPFTIADEKEGAYQARNFQHVVVDTEARPGSADFETLAKGCDLLVVPTVPASLDT